MSAAAAQRDRCWLARFQPTPCDGRMDRIHLIPKGRIKQELQTDDKRLLWHPSLWVYSCRKHHADFDNWVFRVAREDLPPALEEAAKVLGMEWSLDRDYGQKDAA